MVIIYKKPIFIHLILLLCHFWSIVFKQSGFCAIARPECYVCLFSPNALIFQRGADMHIKRLFDYYKTHNSTLGLLLSITWCLSFLAGAHFAFHSRYIEALTVPVVGVSSFSASSLLSLLPFLLMTISCLFSTKWFAITLLAAHGLILSFCSVFILQCFHSGGWLVCAANLFSSYVSACIMFWFAIKHLSDLKSSLKHDFMIGFVLITFSCLFI